MQGGCCTFSVCLNRNKLIAHTNQLVIAMNGLALYENHVPCNVCMRLLLSCCADLQSPSEHAEREPVWRQVWQLQHLLTHSNPEVAQRAVAALAE